MKPADELALIREDKKRLDAREEELKQLILSEPEGFVGDDCVVKVSSTTTTRTRWKELASYLGATEADIALFSDTSTVETFRVSRKRTLETPQVPLDLSEIRSRLVGDKLVLLDLETTGLSYRGGDRVIQIAMLPATIDEVGNITTGNAFNTYVNPAGRRSHPAAFASHGIADEFLRSAPYFENICGQVADLVDGCTLVTHNARFDLGFLFCEFDRIARPFPNNAFIDTLSVARAIWPGEGCALGEVAVRCGVDVTGLKLHDALEDTRLLARIMPSIVAHLRLRI